MAQRTGRFAAALLLASAVAVTGAAPALATFPTEPDTLAAALWFPMELPYPDEGDSDLWLVSPDGTPLRRLTETPNRDEQYARWSPSGDRIAYLGGRYETCEVYTVDPSGTSRQRLTHNRAADSDVAWSPDGLWLAWIRTLAGTSVDQLWVMRPDGSDRRRIPVDLPGQTLATPMWSPDGASIVLSVWVDEDHNFDLFRVDANGPAAERLTDTPRSEVLLDWSPDGQRLLASRARTPFIYGDPDALITMRPDGAAAYRILPDAHFLSARYTPDGQSLHLTEPRTGGWTRLARAELPDGQPRTILSFQGHVIMSDFSC